MLKCFRIILLAGFVVSTSIGEAQDNFFTGLGTLNPSEGFASYGAHLSGDGDVATGYSLSSFPPNSGAVFDYFKWTRSAGMSSLGQTFAPMVLSTDGSVIAGSVDNHIAFYGPGGLSVAPEYTDADFSDGTANLSALTGVHFRGGQSEGFAIRWDATNGVQELDVPTYTIMQFGVPRTFRYDGTSAAAISGDGSIIVGSADRNKYSPGDEEVIVWTLGQGFVSLGLGSGRAVSYDGSTILGADGDGMFAWTAATGKTSLNAPGGRFVSSDFSVIADSTFVWTRPTGAQDVATFLSSHGFNAAGWTNLYISSMSDDGLTFLGSGRNPNGLDEAWIAQVPEPGSFTLVLIGLLGVGGAAIRRHRA